MSWLVDPVTREPLPAFDARIELGPANHGARFVGERDPETGIVVRLRWAGCPCPGCTSEREFVAAAIHEGRRP